VHQHRQPHAPPPCPPAIYSGASTKFSKTTCRSQPFCCPFIYPHQIPLAINAIPITLVPTASPAIAPVDSLDLVVPLEFVGGESPLASPGRLLRNLSCGCRRVAFAWWLRLCGRCRWGKLWREWGLAIMFHSYVRLFCFSRAGIVKGEGGQTLVADRQTRSNWHPGVSTTGTKPESGECGLIPELAG